MLFLSTFLGEMGNYELSQSLFFLLGRRRDFVHHDDEEMSSNWEVEETESLKIDCLDEGHEGIRFDV